MAGWQVFEHEGQSKALQNIDQDLRLQDCRIVDDEEQCELASLTVMKTAIALVMQPCKREFDQVAVES